MWIMWHPVSNVLLYNIKWCVDGELCMDTINKWWSRFPDLVWTTDKTITDNTIRRSKMVNIIVSSDLCPCRHFLYSLSSACFLFSMLEELFFVPTNSTNYSPGNFSRHWWIPIRSRQLYGTTSTFSLDREFVQRSARWSNDKVCLATRRTMIFARRTKVSRLVLQLHSIAVCEANSE